jgi:hypothetical protein
MRNEERIPGVLNAIEDHWYEHPDQRLGQSSPISRRATCLRSKTTNSCANSEQNFPVNITLESSMTSFTLMSSKTGSPSDGSDTDVIGAHT